MSIREDDTYVLWLGTKNGLLQLTPHYKKDGTYRFNCVTYYENEGVQGRVFNRNSVCRSASGELIFGGTNGLTVFNPSRIKYNFYPPAVAVTGFLVQNDHITGVSSCRMISAIATSCRCNMMNVVFL